MSYRKRQPLPIEPRFKEIVTSVDRPVLSRNNLMYNGQKGRCCYCSCQMLDKVAHEVELFPFKGSRYYVAHNNDLRASTREHLQRRADGGTDDPGNIRLACYDCNVNRGDMDWLTYKSYRQGEISRATAFRWASENRNGY